MKDDKKNFAETKKSKGGIIRIWRAFTYSCAGITAAFKHEHAFRQEVYFFVPLAILVCTFPITIFSKALLVSSLILILGFEMINSAIEAVVDDISLEYRELAKRAKDLGSAAVFCAMLIAGITWCTVFYTSISAGDFDSWSSAIQSAFSK